MVRRNGDIKLFSGTANPHLAMKMAEYLGVPIGSLQISRFTDGETYVKFEESVRGVDAFVVQPTCPPVDSNLVELLILMDALRRASAGSITAVVPYYGYARQDKKDAPREAITAKLVADLLSTAGASRIVTVDLHAGAIQGFFNIPVDHLTVIPLMSAYFKDKTLENAVAVSVDEGRVKTVRQVSSRLNIPLAVGYKFRPEQDVSEVTHLAGDVEGKTPIIIEDIISTGRSICECVDTLVKNGCKPEIYVAATHGVLTGPAFDCLNRPEIKEIIVTDTIPLPQSRTLPNLKVLSVAPLLAEAVKCVHEDLSITSLFH